MEKREKRKGTCFSSIISAKVEVCVLLGLASKFMENIIGTGRQRTLTLRHACLSPSILKYTWLHLSPQRLAITLSFFNQFLLYQVRWYVSLGMNPKKLAGCPIEQIWRLHWWYLAFTATDSALITAVHVNCLQTIQLAIILNSEVTSRVRVYRNKLISCTSCLIIIWSMLCNPPSPFFRYHVHAQESEKEAVKAGLSSSAVLGALFFLALSMFGVAFWLVYHNAHHGISFT